jgi:hypothetical protein
MKMLRAVVALAFLLTCAPAFAQWQTPNHSVPLGRGTGVTGFGSAVPGTTGMPFVSQGASSDPAFGTIANSGFAAGAADTYKGSLNGTTVVDVPRAPCTAVNQALRYTAGVGESCGNVVVQTGYDMPVNFGLSAPAPSGGALTINLTQANGSAPTSSSPVQVPFRSTTLATGTVTWTTISASQSITIPSGATLGTANGVPFRVWIFEEYNGGSPELGVATCSSTTAIFPCASWESTLVTTTTISGSATAAGTLYTTTGATLDAVRIIGFCTFSNGLATAGSWTSSCTTLQPFGPGIKKPGDEVQEVYATNSSNSVVGTGSFISTGLSASITPTSPADLVEMHAEVNYGGGSSASSAVTQKFSRGSGPTYVGAVSEDTCPTSQDRNFAVSGYDAPATTSATTYYVYFSSSTNCAVNTLSAGPISFMKLREIMG